MKFLKNSQGMCFVEPIFLVLKLFIVEGGIVVLVLSED